MQTRLLFIILGALCSAAPESQALHVYADDLTSIYRRMHEKINELCREPAIRANVQTLIECSTESPVFARTKRVLETLVRQAHALEANDGQAMRNMQLPTNGEEITQTIPGRGEQKNALEYNLQYYEKLLAYLDSYYRIAGQQDLRTLLSNHQARESLTGNGVNRAIADIIREACQELGALSTQVNAQRQEVRSAISVTQVTINDLDSHLFRYSVFSLF